MLDRRGHNLVVIVLRLQHISILLLAIIYFNCPVFGDSETLDDKSKSHIDHAGQPKQLSQVSQASHPHAGRRRDIVFRLSSAISCVHNLDHHCSGGNARIAPLDRER